MCVKPGRKRRQTRHNEPAIGAFDSTASTVRKQSMALGAHNLEVEISRRHALRAKAVEIQRNIIAIGRQYPNAMKMMW